MSEAIEALRKKLIKKVKDDVSQKYGEKDVHIIRASNVLDDLDSIFNLLAEHAIEWHGINFPELNFLERDNGKYLELARQLGDKSNFSKENVEKILENQELSEKIAEKASNSMGSSLNPESLKEIQSLCSRALELKKLRSELSQFIETEMSANYQNFSKIAGSLLGAKLLSYAGSFERLAMLPSSTIQVLGAEKALFQHLKTGAAPPKHGIIFQHPMVKKVKSWQKGNISRTLAGKLSIAARTDFYGKTDISEKLLEQLNKRIEEIEKQKPAPKKKTFIQKNQFNQQKQFSQQNQFPQKKPFQRTFDRKSFSAGKNFQHNRNFGEKKEFNESRSFERKPFGEKKPYNQPSPEKAWKTAAYGKPHAEKTSYGTSSYNKPNHGTAGYGNKSYGKPAYGSQNSANTSYGKTNYGKPSYGTQSPRKPSHGKPGSGKPFKSFGKKHKKN